VTKFKKNKTKQNPELWRKEETFTNLDAFVAGVCLLSANDS
jgi:hypothetical protein